MADLPRAAKVNLAKLPLLLSDRSQFSFNSLSDQTTALKFKHKRKNFALADLTEPLLILVEPSKPSDQAQVRSTICPVFTPQTASRMLHYRTEKASSKRRVIGSIKNVRTDF